MVVVERAARLPQQAPEEDHAAGGHGTVVEHPLLEPAQQLPVAAREPTPQRRRRRKPGRVAPAQGPLELAGQALPRVGRDKLEHPPAHDVRALGSVCVDEDQAVRGAANRTQLRLRALGANDRREHKARSGRDSCEPKVRVRLEEERDDGERDERQCGAARPGKLECAESVGMCGHISKVGRARSGGCQDCRRGPQEELKKELRAGIPRPAR